MQTTAKTTENASRRADHEAGTNGISAMPPILDATAPVQRMGEGEAAASGDTGVGLSATPNLTGLPDTMKSNLESASGLDMSDVRVHYNSPEPASIGALAYTQGTDIHVGPGQEQHLGHEAWHTVQQKQGRVETTTQFKGMAGNDDQGLEKEADVMGEKISQFTGHSPDIVLADGFSANHQQQPALQRKGAGAMQNAPVQRLRMNPVDGRYYSGASPVPNPDYEAILGNDDAFLTAISTGERFPGGHTVIYVEYFDGGRPVT